MAGCLVQGPKSITFEIELDADGVAQFLVENFSDQEAVFGLWGGSEPCQLTLEPMTRQPLELPLGKGRRSLALEVTGSQDGLFLWGAPYLRRKDAGLPGPVVLITMDTTRRDHLSPYSGKAGTTPSIQAFAEGATVFENAHSTSPWTLPAHGSIFTGKYPTFHGAGLSSGVLPRKHETLAELFLAQGYFTAGFAGGEVSSTRWGVGQGFLRYRDPDDFETRGDVLTGYVESFLQTHHELPLFLFVNYFDPHGLYQAPDEFVARFDVHNLEKRIRHLPIWKDLIEGDNRAWAQVISGKAEVNQDVVRYMRAAYQAEVAFMDHLIGRIFELLKENDLFDPAMIILVADHGEFLGEHGFFSHACRLDPELTEIPLLIKWPHQAEAQRVRELVSLVDLFPTILEMIQYSGPFHNGLILSPDELGLLCQRRTVFLEEHETRFHPLFENMKIASDIYGVQRLDSREVVWRGGITCADRSDPGWAEGSCAVTWQERLQELAKAAELANASAESEVESGLSEDDERRLRALGYLD
jgi:hypothetical protein